MFSHEVLLRAAAEVDNRGDHDVGMGTTIDTSAYDATNRYAAAALLAVAVYNAIEMIPIIYFTFSRFSGLYFWSMVTAVAGVMVYAIGFVLNNFQLTGNQTIPTILTSAFWVPMVSGQSLVLYSRLYLVNLSKRLRRYVLAMIIVNGVVIHTATVVATAGSNSKYSLLFLRPYSIIERIQISIFFIQECVLSGLYVSKARDFLALYRSGGDKTQDKLRAMMLHLILSNVIVVSLDITIIVLEFMGLYYVQVAYKAFVYSVKLKCEVGILNKLVDFVKHARAKRQHTSGSFRMTSQIEREWEKTLRTTFGFAAAAGDGGNLNNAHKQKQSENHHGTPAGAQHTAREVLGVTEGADSGGAPLGGAPVGGGSGLAAPGRAVLGLYERRGSLEGTGRPS